jgi:hypothetical protein
LKVISAEGCRHTSDSGLVYNRLQDREVRVSIQHGQQRIGATEGNKACRKIKFHQVFHVLCEEEAVLLGTSVDLEETRNCPELPISSTQHGSRATIVIISNCYQFMSYYQWHSLTSQTCRVSRPPIVRTSFGPNLLTTLSRLLSILYNSCKSSLRNTQRS